jgi:ribosomal protein L31
MNRHRSSANRASLRVSAIIRSLYHIGQEVEVHHRSHPLYERRIREHLSEQQRRADRFVYLEAAPGRTGGAGRDD